MNFLSSPPTFLRDETFEDLTVRVSLCEYLKDFSSVNFLTLTIYYGIQPHLEGPIYLNTIKYGVKSIIVL